MLKYKLILTMTSATIESFTEESMADHFFTPMSGAFLYM